MSLTKTDLKTLNDSLNQSLREQAEQIQALIQPLYAQLGDDPEQLEDLETISEATQDLLKLLSETKLQDANSVEVRRYLHDIRNPLSAILGFSEFLIDATPNLKVQQIYHISLRAIYHTECIATYIKIKSNDLKLSVYPIYINLSQEIEEMVVNRPSAKVQLTLGESLPTLRLDRQQFQYILSSLWGVASYLAEGPIEIFALDDADGPVRVSFCFPADISETDLNTPLESDWSISKNFHPWQIALYTTLPMLETQQAQLHVQRDATTVRLLLDLPYDNTPEPADNPISSPTVAG